MRGGGNAMRAATVALALVAENVRCARPYPDDRSECSRASSLCLSLPGQAVCS